MNWNDIYTDKRFGTTTRIGDARTEYQRDFDRLVFYSCFRRLQNKTQVFPLPGFVFVHNRLTHSLEVSCVAKSIGKIVGENIIKKYNLTSDKDVNFYRYDLANVLSAAALAHDIGNPPFGHSGEKAISKYFLDSSSTIIESGKVLRNYYKENHWSDLINFEGNANGLRLLTNDFVGKRPGGLRLTYTTLASIIKYPCSSSCLGKGDGIHTKKFNYFHSEKKSFQSICKETNMIEIVNEDGGEKRYKRHPFVYLLEVADDICYSLIDIEDAHRIGILNQLDVETILKDVIECVNKGMQEKTYSNIQSIFNDAESIDDRNDRISFLRAKCINILTILASEIFISKSDEIIKGDFSCITSKT